MYLKNKLEFKYTDKENVVHQSLNKDFAYAFVLSDIIYFFIC